MKLNLSESCLCQGFVVRRFGRKTDDLSTAATLNTPITTRDPIHTGGANHQCTYPNRIFSREQRQGQADVSPNLEPGIPGSRRADKGTQGRLHRVGIRKVRSSGDGSCAARLHFVRSGRERGSRVRRRERGQEPARFDARQSDRSKAGSVSHTIIQTN